ncbi:antiviral RADAR system adenosine triphosphatase RdrA [Undibacterium squillarum]|uniref:KAP NTPase domain-containing protein n=1 Tax=Undibacterium squillarum TaxID=1131567 RepID=A0ABQ2XQ05_9BURK|nr:antiviral RADAR system adenosine triphosphatase RdrA [Undibacterium squillarum]GGX27731.1 hypothetical protein GCM10010946_00480 [Undibacterium squillarum]
MTQNKRYIPIDAVESAVLPDANTLLPIKVYEQLAQRIGEAVKKAEAAKGKSLNQLREHNAISIDGARGTGKTAVLVNLKSYLNTDKHKDILSKVHIFDPVDPTLLENGESLFLHIIVAAVLHDNEVKEAQRKDPNKARHLNQTLEKLVHSLESVETQHERHGMDKVRAMYSNKQLADCVQDFFREVLGLLGKQLLILPIDDVDTSLNRAFENLEIVRRYLATPYVLPIVCGDRSLYDEITWRDFHGRLTKDSSHKSDNAYDRAVELAEEYQRKILPFPRRLTMPEVNSYWQQSDIFLRDGQQAELMPLRNFIAWLEIFLVGPVNGLEGSRLPLPIPSIRALTQLLQHCREFIPQLPDTIRSAKSELEVRKHWPCLLSDGEASGKNATAEQLAKYFCFEPKAGAAYLILLAKQHWQDWSDRSLLRPSILDTPLFDPFAHAEARFELFDREDDLSAWPILLNGRLPEEWLFGIRSQVTMLPYPVAEIGVNTSKGWKYTDEIHRLSIQDLTEDRKNKARFLIALLTQRNFYTNAKQTMLLNIGRIFELLMASIVGRISEDDIYAIMGRAPFFSAAALAPTKTITIDDRDKTTNAADEDLEQKYEAIPDSVIPEIVQTLCRDINKWYDSHHVSELELSPWLVYKVFNKVFSQVASNKIDPNGMKDIGTALNTAAYAFYSTWFAFGSFEKGELFGLENVVATTNIHPENLKNYTGNDQFNINVKPILDAFNRNSSLRAVSIVLAEHPLKKWIDEVIKLNWPKKDSLPNNKILNKPIKDTSKVWLCKTLNISPVPARLSQTRIEKALEHKNLDECRELLHSGIKIYTDGDDVIITLRHAIQNHLAR